MRRELKIAFVQLKLIERWKDKSIMREIDIPKSTYYYWKSMMHQGKYSKLLHRRKPGPNPSSA